MVDSCECGNEPPSSIKCGNVACFLPGRTKNLSAPLYIHMWFNRLGLLTAEKHLKDPE